MSRGIAQTLNPEAGWHPVTADASELAAVARAHERAWREFPYFEFRFGERGQRFSISDTAWLITLCDRAAREAIEQVRWLGIVLSSRGMPQILLERHLEIIHEELGKKRRYGHLQRAARDLRDRRRKVFAQKQSDIHAREFENRVGAVAPFTGFGILLASAVADERLGIEHAVSAVADWATDRTRFPSRWVDAVSASVVAMRER